MKRPTDELEKEFNAGGIFFLEQTTLSDSFFEGAYIGMTVEIAVMTDAILTIPDFSFSVVNKRGVAIYATDWQLVERDGQKLLQFVVSQRIPDDGPSVMSFPLNRAMTFMDLCFYAGNEAIPAGWQVDTYTKLNPEAKLADLGWHLPSRFVDAVIDALGKLNDTVLGGQLEDAILYGVVTKP